MVPIRRGEGGDGEMIYGFYSFFALCAAGCAVLGIPFLNSLQGAKQEKKRKLGLDLSWIDT